MGPHVQTGAGMAGIVDMEAGVAITAVLAAPGGPMEAMQEQASLVESLEALSGVG